MNESFSSFKNFITVKNVLFLILILLLIKGISQITVIAMLFFAGFIIAAALNPIVDKLTSKMNRNLASTIVLLTALFIVFAVFMPLLYAAVIQIEDLLKYLPEQINKIVAFIADNKVYGNKILEYVNVQSIFSSSQSVLKALWSQSLNITMGFTQSVLFFMVICLLVFYFMADKDIIKDGCIKLFPQDMKERASIVYDDISKNVGGYVIAQIIYMFAVGILTAIGMFILGINYSMLLGFIAGLLDIIPIIGPTIALALCLIMAYHLGWVKIALVIVVFLIVQWGSNNLVKPVIFGKFLDLHPLLIILSLLLAAQFLGIWGVILAPAIASLIWILFDEVYIKTINKSE